jgi:hypothetical protein
MSFPTLASFSTADNGGAGTGMTPTTPSGTVDGNLLVALEFSNGVVANPTTPAGWTLQLPRQSWHGGVGDLAIYTKIASGEGATQAFNGAGLGSESIVYVCRVTGQASGPIVVLSTGDTNTNTRLDDGGNTGLSAGGQYLIIAGWGVVAGTISVDSPQTDLGQVTGSGALLNADVGWRHLTVTAGGAGDTQTAVNSLSSPWVGLSIAIKGPATVEDESGLTWNPLDGW